MKKLSIAAVLVLALAGTTMAQAAPKKAANKAKSEWKKDSTKAASDTSMMKHHHKAGMKHTKK